MFMVLFSKSLVCVSSFFDVFLGFGVCHAGTKDVRVFEGKRGCIVCLEMRVDKLIRRLISGELTNYSVIRTSPEPLHTLSAKGLSK
jgi:hypothetical protein